MNPDERAALEERFAAANSDYRQARGTVARGLTIVLVSGLFSIALAAIRFVLGVSEPDSITSVAVSIGPLLFGAILVTIFIVGRRAPALALAAAAVLWLVALVLPFVVDPSRAVLGLASAGGVALSLARIGVMLVLARALPAALQMRRLRQTKPSADTHG